MISLEEIMAKVEAEQFELFKTLISDPMDRKFFICVFLGTFLGDQYFPMNEKNYNIIKDSENSAFNMYCHKIINSINLCQEETDFFNQMVDLKGTDNLVDRCIDLYNNIDGLDKCQLGGNIRKCLKESKNILINK